MSEVMEIPRISNELQFQLFFGKVSDLVFLLCPETGRLLAVNQSFKEKTGSGAGSPAASVFSRLNLNLSTPFPEEGKSFILETASSGTGNEKGLPVQLYVSLAEFNQRQVLLGIAQEVKEPGEDARLQAAEQEKKALLNEVYHRVKNNLNIIVSLLSLQLKRVSEPSVRLLLLESKSRVSTLALLQQKLYASERISEVKAGSYLASLARTVVSSFKAPGQAIHLQADTEDCWLDVDVLMPLGLITHELVANAVLHAFPGQQAAEIQIHLSRQAGGDFLYKVSDNGRGFPAGKELKDFSSLGSQLVFSLSKQLKTEIKQVEKKPSGACFYFTFKGKAQ